MTRPHGAIARSRWITRAGLLAVLGLLLSAGLTTPTSALAGGGTSDTVMADGTATTLGNGWGGR